MVGWIVYACYILLQQIFTKWQGEVFFYVNRQSMSKKELTGIRLMAQTLGVSTATISRALNPGTSHLVKAERREEIMELADKMRYRPNPGARLIQRGVSPTVSVLIPEDEDVFFSEFYARFMGGMVKAMSDSDWEVRINALGRGAGSGDILDELRRAGLGCSGLIYAGVPLTEEEIGRISGYHSPLVLLSSVLPPGYPVDSVNCHVLGVDNYNGARDALRYIVQLGHKNVGVILGPSESRDFSERERGYRDGVKAAGLELDERMFFRGSYDQESGRAACEYFLSLDPVPTALVCASDNIAFGALDYAKGQGVDCPKGISIIGFDDGPWAIACSPKLTTVRQPLGALTERAASILVNAAVDPGEGLHIELPTSLNVRESTAYVRS